MSNSHRSPAGPGGEPLEQEADKNLLIQQALNAILRISLEPISLDEQMHRVLDLLLKLPWLALEAQGCIYLADEEAKVLVRKAQVGMPAGALSACAQVPFGTCLCGQAIDAKEIVFASCLDARHTTLYPGIVPHGHYCVPISSGERPLGLLNLYVRDGHKRMPTEDRFLRAVADVLAGIIERQRTQERLQEQLRLAAFGRDVGLAMSQGDHLPDMLRQCAGAMVRHLDGALARIWTLNEAENVLELQASGGLYTHTDGAHGQVPVGQYKIGLIAQERKPLLTNAVLGDPRVHDQEWARREGLVAFAGYPLLVEDRLVGVMAMFARQPLSEATLEAMASVANGVALGIARVTERYRSLGSRLQLAAIVESSDDAIIGNTLDGVIWSWNRGAERLFGYSAEEVRGKPIALLIPPDHPNELPGIMERLRRGERIDHYETSRVGKGGKRVEVSVSISPIQDATGKVVGASTIARDLSERRRAEQLAEANRRQEEFLALLSHELRNPLASVRHGLQVMNQLGRDRYAHRQSSGRHGAAGAAPFPPGGRPARCLPGHPGHPRPAQGAGEPGHGGAGGGGDQPPPDRGTPPGIDGVAPPATRPLGGRPGAARPNPHEPVTQRRPIHRGGRPHLVAGRAGGQRGRPPGAGYRYGHSG